MPNCKFNGILTYNLSIVWTSLAFAYIQMSSIDRAAIVVVSI